MKRWEDDATVWKGPFYGDQALGYAPEVESAPVAGRIITCVDVVDWDGDGGRDLLLSAWDPCYDGRVFLRREIGRNADGTPRLGEQEVVENVRGYVTSVKDGDSFHLVSASRMRQTIHVHPNIGSRQHPEFADPIVLELDAEWVKGNEYFHMVRFHDIDGDGRPELIVGTDYWDDYWPNGLEWNDEGYRGYDPANRWLGGPLRGYVYAFKVEGPLSNPRLGKGRPLMSGDVPLEVYGQLAPALASFDDGKTTSIVCGEFWNILHIANQVEGHQFDRTRLLRSPCGNTLELDQCIHMPCIVDWDGDGRPDILVGAEDGYVTFLRNTGETIDGDPVFEHAGRVETTRPIVHAGVLPCPVAADFTGTGRIDLVVGNSTGELLYYEMTGAPEAPALSRETMLEADGKPIRIAAGPTGSIQGPSEKMFGYSCPTAADWSGTGRLDILVGDVTGYQTLYRNLGGSPPKLAAPQRLSFEGKPLKTVWRVRPAVTDWLQGNGLHYLTLDEEGVLSDYRKLGETELGDKRHLHWEDGTPMRFTEDVGGGRGRVKLCVCDWTMSGRLDLIVGTHARASVPPGPGGMPRHTTGQAGIFYLENVGTASEPVFAHPKPFSFRGETIAMAMHVAAPEAVDLTGTGLPGLLVGVEDGSLVWLPREELSW
ncbi:VCBS repeat-containing protein [Nitratireductor sp. GISD-1A_MAKvit]|uniref:FG-GAP repeat domain-containing protein n=1 Tax=Nitratireductor sp. GISD-1A_MAKvit TaxID=3234198 RepID=UPI0034666E87